MNRELGDLFGSLVGATMIIVGLLLLALLVTPVFLVGVALYIAIRLYLESPKRLERKARAETLQLYEHARRGRVRLSKDEIAK